jgi:hypothetical protein
MDDETNKHKGRAKGGAATAAKMTDEQKAARARAGAVARWGPKPLRATHMGNFQKDFGIDVDCYVLDDEAKTAVISQRGMGQALGLGLGGSRLTTFIQGAKVAPYVGHELREKIKNPLIFQPSMPGTKLPPSMRIHGYDVTHLIDICKAVIQAESEGKLLASQAKIAKQAHVIVGASAKAGIKGLVYALAGYDATREEVVRAFKLFVQEEAREYEREFPPQLYSEWYRLYQPNAPERGRPWKFKHLTLDQVYYPLARSNGKILNLARESKSNSTARHSKLHQFLSEVGVKALRTHLGQLLGIARISQTAAQYEGHVKALFGDQPDLPGIEPAK